MVQSQATNACSACAVSKRKCGRQYPRCSRCMSKGIECRYSSNSKKIIRWKSNATILSVPVQSLDGLTTTSFSVTAQHEAPLHNELHLDSCLTKCTDGDPVSSWFNGQEAWCIDRELHLEFDPSTLKRMKHSLATFNQWLHDWVEKGSNPFVHPHLYRSRFPLCIREAFVTLSCYLHRTQSNQEMILRVIERRAKSLVAEYKATSSNDGLDGANPTSFDSLSNLARVQALLIYQALCLYDGDIRLRYIGEIHMSILNNWMEEMVAHASHDIYLGESVVNPIDEQRLAIASKVLDVAHQENIIWYSWFLSECIRRTWLVASGIQGAYLTIQRHSSIPCRGGMMITTSRILWEAQSSRDWQKTGLVSDAGFMQIAGTHNLLSQRNAHEIDDFTMMILQVTFGKENVET